MYTRLNHYRMLWVKFKSFPCFPFTLVAPFVWEWKNLWSFGHIRKWKEITRFTDCVTNIEDITRRLVYEYRARHCTICVVVVWCCCCYFHDTIRVWLSKTRKYPKGFKSLDLVGLLTSHIHSLVHFNLYSGISHNYAYPMLIEW